MDLQSVAQSPTLAMHDLADLRRREGLDVVRFGFGQSPFPPPRRVIEALKENAHRNAYAPVAGLPLLREAVADYHTHHENISCTADDILIGAGSKSLIYAVLASFRRASVIIPAPAWVSYSPQADLLGHQKVLLPRHAEKDWRIAAKDLQVAAGACAGNAQKIFILTSPGNPDGIVYDEESLQALAAVAAENDILILSDEIYGRLTYTGTHKSIARFYPEKTVVTGGLSKWCGAGGWRLGTAIVPDALADLRRTMIGVLSEIVSCAPTPVQYAAIEAYRDTPDMSAELQRRRDILKTLAHDCHATLAAAKISCTKAQGGFYSFVDFSPLQEDMAAIGVATSAQLCERLLKETGVALLSGDSFGMSPQHLSARLAFVDFDGEEALAAAQKEPVGQDFVKKHCAKTYDGLRQIAIWAQEIRSRDATSHAALRVPATTSG